MPQLILPGLIHFHEKTVQSHLILDLLNTNVCRGASDPQYRHQNSPYRKAKNLILRLFNCILYNVLEIYSVQMDWKDFTVSSATRGRPSQELGIRKGKHDPFKLSE